MSYTFSAPVRGQVLAFAVLPNALHGSPTWCVPHAAHPSPAQASRSWTQVGPLQQELVVDKRIVEQVGAKGAAGEKARAQGKLRRYR